MTIVAALAAHAGAWAGTNGFRLVPSDPLYDAPATAEVSMAAGGSLAAIRYAWSHPNDGAQDGLLVVGAADDPDGVAAFWGDSWHQSPTPPACAGSENGGVTTIGYDSDTGWRWQITVDATDPGTLRLHMNNVISDHAGGAGLPTGAYPTMVMDLRRPNT